MWPALRAAVTAAALCTGRIACMAGQLKRVTVLCSQLRADIWKTGSQTSLQLGTPTLPLSTCYTLPQTRKPANCPSIITPRKPVYLTNVCVTKASRHEQVVAACTISEAAAIGDIVLLHPREDASTRQCAGRCVTDSAYPNFETATIPGSTSSTQAAQAASPRCHFLVIISTIGLTRDQCFAATLVLVPPPS